MSGILPAPVVNDIRGPSGPDIAAVFGDRLTLTYWDLWCLITAKQKFAGELEALRDALVHRRLTGSFWSYRVKELVEDLIALVDDLKGRLTEIATPTEILSRLPERLLKKETQKAVRNILEQDCSYPSSEPMLRSPRRLLDQEAYRGMWSELPIDPTIFADRFRPLFLPSPKLGYIPKGQTSALRRKIERCADRELAMNHLFTNESAHRYAIYRALMALFHEEHNWDDSYGIVGDLAKTWLKGLLEETPASVGAESRVFIKDLLMMLCWENYGLTRTEETAQYIKQNLALNEQEIAIAVLNDIKVRAAAAFQNYKAEEADRILKAIGDAEAIGSRGPAVAGKRSHLRLVRANIT